MTQKRFVDKKIKEADALIDKLVADRTISIEMGAVLSSSIVLLKTSLSVIDDDSRRLLLYLSENWKYAADKESEYREQEG